LHSLTAAQQSTTSLKGLQLALDKTQEGEDAQDAFWYYHRNASSATKKSP
jgi:hypothetical protein